MGELPQVRGVIGKVRIPRYSLCICLGIALLVPHVGAMPDLPFGQFSRYHYRLNGTNGLFGVIAGSLFMSLISAAFISPVFLAGKVLKKCPLAYWMSLAAYLCASLVGFGIACRTLGGDGLEFLFILVLAALAATCGAAVGFLLNTVIRSQSIQLWVVRWTLAVAVLGSLTWSVIDAYDFEERGLAWQKNRQAQWISRGIDDFDAGSRSIGRSQMACQGYASADKALRLFSESECTGTLRARYFANGECLKEQGGSYSWDLRWMNQSCP